MPVLRPQLSMCKPTSVSLEDGRRVVVMADKGGVAKALVQRLETAGVQVLCIENAPDAEALANRLKEFLAAGPVHGVYWLPALDNEAAFATWILPPGMKLCGCGSNRFMARCARSTSRSRSPARS